jgi:iron complex transport system ATP-binding protein
VTTDVPAAVLTARGVTVRLGGRPVVDRVDLDVADGEVLGIVGPNGSGKSTLVRALFGAVPLADGSIVLEGRPLRAWSRNDIARRIAVVAQEPPAELPLRVEESVLLGRLPYRSSFARWTAEDREAAQAAMAATDTVGLVGRYVWSLSGGERQRVLIARALAQRTRLVLWDEPTNHLDLRHAHDGLALLHELDLTGIVVLHDLNLATRYCDRLLVMLDGSAVMAGPPDAIADPRLIERVFGVRAGVVDHEGVPQLLFAGRC